MADKPNTTGQPKPGKAPKLPGGACSGPGRLAQSKLMGKKGSK